MSLIEQYEQQYAVLIAEITAHIGRLNIYSGAERKELCIKIENSLPEAQELLEQIGLEIRDADQTHRQTLTNKLKSYQTELKRLQTEYKNLKEFAKSSFDSGDDFDDIGINDDQRQKLLENSERIERTGKTLTEGYRIVLETEQIGAQVLKDLHHQRETIQSARTKVRETNADLSVSSRILNSIFMRSLREKAILFGVGIFFLVGISLSIFFSISNN